MPRPNTLQSYGSVARALHWLTALLILTAIPLGLIANDMALTGAASAARKAQLFSLHKTLGIAAFAVALLRILWALVQPRPAPLHPGRRLETLAAEAVHWTLYLSLVAVPLSGWVHHAATTGFAPILWPLGQGLPFVPVSEAVAASAGALHWIFTKLLIASLILHVAGALKHALIDRDGTLARMISGRAAGHPAPHPKAPALAALAVYAAAAALAIGLTAPPEAAASAPQAATAGNWQVSEGSIAFRVRQMGAEVEGRFGIWSAEIIFDETPVDGRNGQVTASIDLASLALGSVGDQAKGPEFLDVAKHPTATFTADIRPEGAGYVAEGTLDLHGQSRPLSLPFALQIDGDGARMTGTVALDRRDFGIGAGYEDEETVGFAVTLDIALTARRN